MARKHKAKKRDTAMSAPESGSMFKDIADFATETASIEITEYMVEQVVASCVCLGISINSTTSNEMVSGAGE